MTRKRGTHRSGRARLGVALLAVPLLSSCANEGITTKAHQVHDLYRLIFILALPVFLAVEGLLLWNITRYRKRDATPAPHTVAKPTTIVGVLLLRAGSTGARLPFRVR